MRKIQDLIRNFGPILSAVVLVGLLGPARAAYADINQTYDLAWSGAAEGNGASATGEITLDLSTLPNPEGGYTDILSDITSLTVSVTGAGTGDGTFTLADLCACSVFGTYTYWYTAGATLDMEGDVLAQLQAAGGDFNLFFTPPGPQGSNVLVLTTDGLGGYPMSMTEFSPVVPEPGSLLLLGTILLGIGVGARRRRRV